METLGPGAVKGYVGFVPPKTHGGLLGARVGRIPD